MNLMGIITVFIVCLLVALPWMLFAVLPLLLVTFIVIIPAVYFAYSKVKLVIDRIRLKEILEKFLKAKGKAFKEACACTKALNDGKINLYVDFKGSNSQISYQVAATSFTEAVTKMSSTLIAKTECVVNCGRFPCANKEHCPNSLKEKGKNKDGYHEILHLDGSFAHRHWWANMKW